MVAMRYAAAPTYSELLAAQAKREAEEAALAEHRAREARAAQEQIAQDQIVNSTPESILKDSLQPFPNSPDQNARNQNEQLTAADQGSPSPAIPVMPRFAARTQEMHLHQSIPEPEPTLEDLWASALVESRSLLPSKLIEFPRELVSSRRIRPGSAQDGNVESTNAPSQPEATQLRIFEVQPELADLQNTTGSVQENVSTAGPAPEKLPASEAVNGTAPATTTSNPVQDRSGRSQEPAKIPITSGQSRTGAATNRSAVSSAQTSYVPTGSASSARAYKNLEWAAISLDKEPATARRKADTNVADYIPFLIDPASIDRRLMAFAVDFAAVTAGFLAFLLVFAAATPHLPTGLPAIALGGAVYVALWILYQMLFFSLSGSTAGMLYAHIALCTFDDQNPTRPALRRRLAAWWLSCLPLGIGFLWCFVDEDNLSWHDRITRMYQREY